jgi:hypothetical protein
MESSMSVSVTVTMAVTMIVAAMAIAFAGAAAGFSAAAFKRVGIPAGVAVLIAADIIPGVAATINVDAVIEALGVEAVGVALAGAGAVSGLLSAVIVALAVSVAAAVGSLDADGEAGVVNRDACLSKGAARLGRRGDGEDGAGDQRHGADSHSMDGFERTSEGCHGLFSGRIAISSQASGDGRISPFRAAACHGSHYDDTLAVRAFHENGHHHGEAARSIKKPRTFERPRFAFISTESISASCAVGRRKSDHRLEVLEGANLDDLAGRTRLDLHHLAGLEGIGLHAALGRGLVLDHHFAEAGQRENAWTLLAEVLADQAGHRLDDAGDLLARETGVISDAADDLGLAAGLDACGSGFHGVESFRTFKI